MILMGLREFSTKPFTEEPRTWWTMRVPSMLCHTSRHLKRESDRKQYGEHSFLHRSMHLAEFTDDARPPEHYYAGSPQSEFGERAGVFAWVKLGILRLCRWR